MIYFPDTNFLLHFLDPTDIPWSEVTPDPHVRLIISGNTQREVDKKKFELRGRAQQRARKWASIIGDLILSEQPRELRPASPRVTVELGLERPPGWSPPNDLNDSVPGDDSYIADVLAFRSAAGGTDCAILTADTGPLGKAKRHGVPAVSARRDGWELPEEADNRDKVIQRLERELEHIRRAGPVIELTALVNDAPVRGVSLEIVRYRPISDDGVKRLLDELKRRHPRVDAFPQPSEEASSGGSAAGRRIMDIAKLSGPFDWQAPTEQQIASYHTSYGNWLAEAERLATTIASSMQERRFETIFQLMLANVGSAAAEDLRISISTTTGLSLRDTDDQDDEDSEKYQRLDDEPRRAPSPLRPPPSAPTWTKIYRRTTPDAGIKLAAAGRPNIAEIAAGLDRANSISRALSAQTKFAKLMAPPHLDVLRTVSGISDPFRLAEREAFARPLSIIPPSISLPRPRDREGFYWREQPSAMLAAEWQFECGLFRHHVDPEVWTVPIVTALNEVPINGGAVHVSVHARNLPRPHIVTVPVRVNARDVDTEAIVRALLSLEQPKH